MEYQSEAVI